MDRGGGQNMDWENMHSRSMLFDLIPAFIRQTADAQGQVSPRSFPAAFRQVVEDSAQYCRKYGPALHPATIRDRIRQAATTRVQEILTPHPWVRLVFSVLKEPPLPWTWDEVVHRWQTAFPVGPAGLPVTHLPSSRTQHGWSGVRDAPQRLGILYIRSDGHPDVPELYRLESGFPRRHYPLQFEFHFELDFLYSFTL